MLRGSRTPRLLVLDIDNTLFDWVTYYVECLTALMSVVSEMTGVPRRTLWREARAVFSAERSIEYPFLVQRLPSVVAAYQGDIDALLAGAVDHGRTAFLTAAQRYLQPYPGVLTTLDEVRRRWPEMRIVALTDAPRYVAMWKLNKLGVLDFFHAVYGLADPRLPTCADNRRVLVDAQILLKHLKGHDFGFSGHVRVLPSEYEKPGRRGLKTVLMDYELDEASVRPVVWVGDNLVKDVGLGRSLGVCSVWAAYGARVSGEMMERLRQFSPLENLRKHTTIPDPEIPLAEPDVTIEAFAEILSILQAARAEPAL